ncbi:hypothetical protein [uncultured Micrococcus sp.]|uniref:hypothetical protein n=1 Tax=uncultured Micrococcus sp. TaxID=114051 RepID=UPI0025DB2D36|nr:hypothetical protein [uncultured Micrococcus sp.]
MPAEPRRRGPRRADAPGTGPASADGPEPVLASRTGGGAPPRGASAAASATVTVAATPRAGRALPADPAEAEHDRWLREQRPPHWG